MTELACPCRSGEQYQHCCQALHDGLPAQTAEALMRSRYSAFVLGKIDYLLDTLAPELRQKTDREQLQATIAQTQWLGLQVLGSKLERDAASVEFVAWYQDTPLGQLHERSRFYKLDQRWLYLDGVILKPIKPERNSPCFCGSGEKYKRCHGR